MSKMKKLGTLLPAALLTIAAAQSTNAAAIPAAQSAPLLMQFVQAGDYAEPAQLSAFAYSVVQGIETQMMPKSCDGDFECWKKICGTGSFCGRVQVDDTDQAC